MLYQTTKEVANAVLMRVLASPVTSKLPRPAIKRVDDPYFVDDHAYYLVWPNGFHVPVKALELNMKYNVFWEALLMSEYADPQPLEPGTSEGIRWKD